MSGVLVQMSMSLDGYIADPTDNVEVLHEWMSDESDRAIIDDLRTGSGAMISGRRLYDITHGWNPPHFGGIPMFVITHRVPDEIPVGATPITFVTDGIESAVARAKEVAVGKYVYVVGGASIVQKLIEAGLVDELRIDLIPRLLGDGIPLFAKLRRPLRLDQLKVTASPAVTHLRYKVLR